MNVYEFVIGIIIVVTVGGLIRLKMGIRKDHKGNEYSIHEERAGKNELRDEIRRLRDEVKSLKERQAVIERITVEKESSLEREIDRLRDE
jgi:predicted nuclease with TOPRIM domain